MICNKISSNQTTLITSGLRSVGCNQGWGCPWCNGYRHRKWTRRHEFKSWTRLIAFHIALTHTQTHTHTHTHIYIYIYIYI